MRYLKKLSKFVSNKVVFCGIDVHEKYWQLCFVCDGEVIEKVRIASNYDLLRSHLSFYSAARQIKCVYEAGFTGFWLCRKLQSCGISCIVTPPNKMVNTGDRVKTDKRDAEKLAMYLSAGLLKVVYVPPKSVESDRRVIRRRRQLMKQQRQIKSQIRSFLKLYGLKAPDSVGQNWSGPYLAWLESIEFESLSDRFTLSQMLRSFCRIHEEVLEVTQFIRFLSRSESYKNNFSHLSSIKGVGLITGMNFLLEIFDFERFDNVGKFASYLGLTPAQYSSGEHIRFGQITRQGNPYLRSLLVQSAWTVIRYEPSLKEKYETIRAKSNGKKAIVAVARTLAIRLRKCLLDDCDYIIKTA